MPEVDSCLDFLQCLKQTANKPLIQAIKTWICHHIVKQMTEFLPSVVSFKSAQQKTCHFFLLYKTPVNKSESFKARLKATENSGEATFNYEWHILHTSIFNHPESNINDKEALNLNHVIFSWFKEGGVVVIP